MKKSLLTCVMSCALALPLTASSDSPVLDSASAVSDALGDTHDGRVPLAGLIASVAKKTGKKYLVDPRVHAGVLLIGEDPKSVTYPELLTILQQTGYAAVEAGGYVQVIPESGIRLFPLPLWNGKESYPDAEYVTRIIPVATLPVGPLVPVLRPLMPQHAHLSAVVCSNQIVMVDTVGNVRRIESLIKALDTGSTAFKPERCEPASKSS